MKIFELEFHICVLIQSTIALHSLVTPSEHSSVKDVLSSEIRFRCKAGLPEQWQAPRIQRNIPTEHNLVELALSRSVMSVAFAAGKVFSSAAKKLFIRLLWIPSLNKLGKTFSIASSRKVFVWGSAVKESAIAELLSKSGTFDKHGYFKMKKKEPFRNTSQGNVLNWYCGYNAYYCGFHTSNISIRKRARENFWDWNQCRGFHGSLEG